MNLRLILGKSLFFAAEICLFAVLGIGTAQAQGTLIATKKTIADITAILDQQKVDPAKAAKDQAAAQVQPPENADKAALLAFYYQRARARGEIGRLFDAIEDAETALEHAKDPAALVRGGVTLPTLYSYVAGIAMSAGQTRTSLKYRELALKAADDANNWGMQIYAAKAIALICMSRNNFDEAEKWLVRADQYRRNFSAVRGREAFKPRWEAEIELGRAELAIYHGRFAETEARYAKAFALLSEAIKLEIQLLPPEQRTTPGSTEAYQDNILSWLAIAKQRQGRLLEAEADIRLALLNRLKSSGKNTPVVAAMLNTFSRILGEQGRYAEADKLATVVVDIYTGLGFAANSTRLIAARQTLAVSRSKVGRWDDAIEQYGLIDAEVEKWPDSSKITVLLSSTRVLALLNTKNLDRALDTAQRLYDVNLKRLGDKHLDTALAEGYLAVAKAHKGATDAALANFKSAAAILTANSNATDDDEAIGPSNFESSRRYILENYIAFLAQAKRGDQQAAIESFNLADRMRSNSVNKALSASAAREAVSDPALAALARREQDLEKLIGAQFSKLNNALAQPPEDRDEKSVVSLRADVAKMRLERTNVRKEIERKFPDYAVFVDPQAPSVDEIRKALRAGEVYLSIYLGDKNSFVWAVPKDGAIAFSTASIGVHEVGKTVDKLREALEPHAKTLEEIPPFDLKLAYALYKLLLLPIEAAWKPAKSLVVTTNGALGLLPLGLLPTAPTQVTAGSVMFEEYKAVPWLSKTHAVSMVPSASALKTLRNLAAAPKNRETMIGFGDPFFSEEQAKAAGVTLASAPSATATRGIPLQRRNAPQTNGVDAAELSMLPRLPDTTEELKSIAMALRADPAKVLHLGKEANTKRVQTTNLTKYKVVVFATHGLVPGELEGLTQPALALSAPAVAGTDGDGLLTMGEILGLKLNADWVVLSACNTGAGSGAGAEAASGLARAFFYAGTRALLVTNWSVHSVSARELVTDLFTRQSNDATVTRAEALRAAMVELMGGPGFVSGGKTQFSYAHPLFWAPYSLIGDGGGV